MKRLVDGAFDASARPTLRLERVDLLGLPADVVSHGTDEIDNAYFSSWSDNPALRATWGKYDQRGIAEHQSLQFLRCKQ
jgi:hypothetical protein